jgi:hypothetical protein
MTIELGQGAATHIEGLLTGHARNAYSYSRVFKWHETWP